MKIVAIPDLHGSTLGIDRIGADLTEADVVILAGDLTNFGREPEARRIVDTVKRYNKNVYAVQGNCDFPEVHTYLEREGLSLHRKSVDINRLVLLGIGGSLVCPGNTPTEFSEEEFESFLDEASHGLEIDTPKILISHQPPINTKVDLVQSGDHVGSASVREFIEKFQPFLCISGHIHESVGIDEIGKTKLINSGPLRNGKYAYAEIGDRLNLLEIREIS
jgi:Icc-related predicted phosphoesterase